MYFIQILKKEVENHEILKNQWFQRNQETLSKEEVTLWLTQEYFVSLEFINWFLETAKQAPTHESKITLVQNIWEELGEGNAEKTHVKILEKLLVELGLEPKKLSPLPKTSQYLARMKEIIYSDFWIGIGALGPANEYLLKMEYQKVSEIYNKLKDAENLPYCDFFNVNLVADEHHSEMLFQLIVNLCDTNEKKAKIIRGNLEALNARILFYEGLNDANNLKKG